MYGYDSYGGVGLTSCPICYCMVEEKFMAMHIMWHEETDPKEEEQYVAQPIPFNPSPYDLWVD